MFVVSRKWPLWKWIIQVVQQWSFVWIETLSWFKSLLVQIPFCVVIGWPMGTHMDLNFELYETASLFITVLVVAFMLKVRTHSNIYLSTYIFCYLYRVLFMFTSKGNQQQKGVLKRVPLQKLNLVMMTWVHLSVCFLRVYCFGALQAIWMWNLSWKYYGTLLKFTLPLDYIGIFWRNLRGQRHFMKWTDWIAPVICASIAVTSFNYY